MSYKETLLNPIKIGNRTIQNRFFMQAMECNDQDENGNPSDTTLGRYQKLAQGGAGLVSLEAVTVTRESRSRENQLTILPPNEKPLAKFVESVKQVNPDMQFV